MRDDFLVSIFVGRYVCPSLQIFVFLHTDFVSWHRNIAMRSQRSISKIAVWRNRVMNRKFGCLTRLWAWYSMRLQLTLLCQAGEKEDTYTIEIIEPRMRNSRGIFVAFWRRFFAAFFGIHAAPNEIEAVAY